MSRRYQDRSAMAQHGQRRAGGPAPVAKAQKHKIVMETVTQEKKRLRTALTFEAQPPAGYTFIPAGNPELTKALKEFSRNGNYSIYSVTTTRHNEAHELSKEVHRIGFHFPSIVVDDVCRQYGIHLSKAGTIIEEDDLKAFRNRRQKIEVLDQDKDQVTVNTEAKDAIRDLFPNIPDNDLFQIIKTAFQKGQRKVGTANELPLIRRAQLAVVAHVRHVYTRYDKLLRQVHYNEARGMVEGPTLRKLVEWRGDDDGGKDVLEDVFREVVVISDQEESDDEPSDEGPSGRRRSPVEFISRSADHQQIELMPINYASRDHLHDQADDDIPQNFHYVQRSVRRKPLLHQPDMDRRVVQYSAWDRAREQYRANPVALPPIELETKQDQLPELLPRHAIAVTGGPSRRQAPSVQGLQTPPRLLRVNDSVGSHSWPRRSPPTTFRGADGDIYERVDTRPDQYFVSQRLSPPTKRSYTTYTNDDIVKDSFRTEDKQNMIVQSIEGHESSKNHRRTSQNLQEPGRSYTFHDTERLDLRSARHAPGKLLNATDLVDLTARTDKHEDRRRRDVAEMSIDQGSQRYDASDGVRDHAVPPNREYISVAPSARWSLQGDVNGTLQPLDKRPVYRYATAMEHLVPSHAGALGGARPRSWATRPQYPVEVLPRPGNTRPPLADVTYASGAASAPFLPSVPSPRSVSFLPPDYASVRTSLPRALRPVEFASREFDAERQRGDVPERRVAVSDHLRERDIRASPQQLVPRNGHEAARRLHYDDYPEIDVAPRHLERTTSPIRHYVPVERFATAPIDLAGTERVFLPRNEVQTEREAVHTQYVRRYGPMPPPPAYVRP